MRKRKRLVVRTVVGLAEPDVQHHGHEVILNLSPEQHTKYLKRARKAGKKSIAEYFQDDVMHQTAEPVAPTPPPAADSFTHTVTAALYPPERRKKEAKRIEKATARLGMTLAEWMSNLLEKALQEVEATGDFQITGYTPPLLSPKLSARVAEVDRVFGFGGECRFGEWNLENIIDDLKDGRDDLLFDGWLFDDPAKSHRKYRAMVRRWRRADGLPPIKLPPWREIQGANAEGRAVA